MSDAPDSYYDSTDGLRLHYRLVRGEQAGLPVVCLPGISRNSRDFEDLALHLAGRHPVICPDLRGRGHSAWDPNWQNYQPQTYVGDVERLLDALGIERAAFVGTSLGGIVSSLFAASYPARVAGIVLNDIGPEIGAAGLARIKGYLGKAAPVASWDEAVAQARELYEIAWPGLDDAKWRRLVRRAYRAGDDGRPVLDLDPMVGEAARRGETNASDPWPVFDRLRNVPVLLVHGALSDILTDDIVAKMRARKPDLDYVRVENRGHVPLLDEPEVLVAIDRFLGELS